MALIPSQNSNDVVNLEDPSILVAQKRLIQEWEPRQEVWSLRFGAEIISIFAGVTGYTCNRIFRSSVRLRSPLFTSTSVLVTLAPAFIAYTAHQQLISNNLLLYKNNCLVCTELKAITSITLSGFLYPLIIAPAITLPLAGQMGIRIPYIYEVKELAKYFKIVLTANKVTLLTMLIVNAIVTGFVTYNQFQSMITVTEVLMNVNKYMDDNNMENQEIVHEEMTKNNISFLN